MRCETQLSALAMKLSTAHGNLPCTAMRGLQIEPLGKGCRLPLGLTADVPVSKRTWSPYKAAAYVRTAHSQRNKCTPKPDSCEKPVRLKVSLLLCSLAPAIPLSPSQP
eukprot:4905979-Amphidinium_carterae.1